MSALSLTARIGAVGLDFLDKVLTLGHLTEDNVLAIKPRSDDCSNEELGTVGVGTGIGHREEERTLVAELKVLIGEFVAVDGLSARQTDSVMAYIFIAH